MPNVRDLWISQFMFHEFAEPEYFRVFIKTLPQIMHLRLLSDAFRPFDPQVFMQMKNLTHVFLDPEIWFDGILDYVKGLLSPQFNIQLLVIEIWKRQTDVDAVWKITSSEACMQDPQVAVSCRQPVQGVTNTKKARFAHSVEKEITGETCWWEDWMVQVEEQRRTEKQLDCESMSIFVESTYLLTRNLRAS